MKKILMWLFCGDGAPTTSTRFYRGLVMNLDTRRGRFVAWLLDLDYAVRQKPTDFRWWLADQLSRAALRLRRQEVSVFGHYDAQKGNRAAMLAEAIWIEVVIIDISAADNIDTKLQELASLAGATWIRNDDEAQ